MMQVINCANFASDWRKTSTATNTYLVLARINIGSSASTAVTYFQMQFFWQKITS